MTKEYKVALACRITLTTAQALDTLAASTGKSKASIVEAALMEYISKQKGGK